MCANDDGWAAPGQAAYDNAAEPPDAGELTPEQQARNRLEAARWAAADFPGD